MRPTVPPIGSVPLARAGSSGLVRVAPWHETSSRGTAGRNRSAGATRWACTCRRRPGGRCGSRWHGSAREREVVFSADAVDAGEHETPPDAASKGCGWPVALALDVEPSWRSGYYEVVLEIDVGEKVRRDHAFFVVRPSPGTRMVLALATNTWHAYNDFGGPNLYTGGTHVAMQRPMAAGYLYKPPGKGRRVTGTGAPDPQNAAHVGYIQINHLSGYAGSAGWPDWELPFMQWAEHEGFEIGVCTNADLEEHPEVLHGARACTSPSGTTSTGHAACVTRSRRSSPAAAMRRSSRATRRCGRCGSRGTSTTSWSATRPSSRTIRCWGRISSRR